MKRLFLALAIATWIANFTLAAEPAQLIKTIKAVGKEGQGNEAASQALRELAQADAKVLPTILTSFDGANLLASNWLRSAVETIADRTVKKGKDLPIVQLEQFVLDIKQNPRARRLAYEWLAKVDGEAQDRLIPGMLLDPSPEFRRDAVSRLIDSAKTAEADKQRRGLYLQALKGATDDDQVKAIVKPLREMGEKVDLQRHFGFLANWQMIGPFNNRELVGFAATYPPENEVKLKAKYEGQLGEVAWAPQSTKDDYGLLDIGKQIKNYKGSVMYATTEFTSSTERPIEFRLGTPNAWKLWLNGKYLFGRDEYHRGTKMDQYRVAAKLKPGKNVILLKICQNEQEQSWAQRYQFQIRICEASGVAVLPSTTRKTSQLSR
ncbi:MAG: hypothetical protein CMJ78_16665 [Planctomycetaceae bacterium]|nr:hypothetical protein [Planctomycetaceae bacterium]